MCTVLLPPGVNPIAVNICTSTTTNNNNNNFGAESCIFQFAIQHFKDQDIHRIVILPVVLYGCETWSLTFV